MCGQCVRTPRLSRRRFLQGGSAATVTGLLAACGRRAQPSPSPADGRLAGAAEAPADARPSLAGQFVAFEGASLTLAAPVDERTLSLGPKVTIRDASGKRVARDYLATENSVAVWMEGESVTAVSVLPPMAEPVTIPDDLAQPAASGATRALGPLSLITRDGWGAAAAPQYVAEGEAGPFDAETNRDGWLVYPEPLAGWLKTIVVHHSALEYDQGPQAIQRLHMRRRGWADIGYHFLVDGLGQLYEGRHLDIRGAHTGGFNTGSVGVCLMGNFDVVAPAAVQLATLRALTRYLRDTYTITHMAGHRDFQPEVTSCPGASMWPLLPELAAGLALTYGTGGYTPPSWS